VPSPAVAAAHRLKQLIVTADDFGAAGEVNDAVEAAHRDGILTAASLMVAAPAAADAIARARRTPSLRVGLHVVLTDGAPLLPRAAVGSLIDADGRFRTDLASFGTAIACSRRVRRELAAEISAQFAAFCDSGLALDHCNAHQHFHLHPLVGRLLTAIGRRFGLRAVRLPLEPARVLRAVERRRRHMPALLTPPFALLLRQRLRAAGIASADSLFGLRWSGQMTRQRLLGLIRNLPPGLTEIYLHPATAPFPGAARGYRYREEFEALTAPEVVAACRDPALRLGGYSDFLEPVTNAAAARRGDLSQRSGALGRLRGQR
jgi:chitin disaccharide deacetylase